MMGRGKMQAELHRMRIAIANFFDPVTRRFDDAWFTIKKAYDAFQTWRHRPPRRILKLTAKERTRQALHHLKAAKDYHDKYYALEHDRDKENYQRFMAQHINKARQYDAKAELRLE